MGKCVQELPEEQSNALQQGDFVSALMKGDKSYFGKAVAKNAKAPKRVAVSDRNKDLTEEQLKKNPYAGMPTTMQGVKDKVKVSAGGAGFDANGNETSRKAHTTS